MFVRTKSLIVGVSIAIVVFIAIAVVATIMRNYVDISFATEVSIRFHYGDKEIDVVVTDEDDIRIIKESLKGISFRDYPACGFSLDTSIKFTDGSKTIVLCPGCDACGSKARIGDSDRYIHIKDWKALEAVLEKYGMTFPCI